MDDLNDVIPRLQAYIKILEKDKKTPKEELIFQKERLKKIIDLAKHKIIIFLIFKLSPNILCLFLLIIIYFISLILSE